MQDNLQKQLDVFKEFLRSGTFLVDSEAHKKAKDFIETFPRALSEEERREMRFLFAKAFNIPEVDTPITPQIPFEDLIPKKGFLREYYEYTIKTEPPTVFHFVAALTVLGATLERRVYFDKGVYRVYPAIAAVLIAPTGKCRKTSATNTALKLGREVGLRVLSDKLTPEALIEGLSGKTDATGLVYAPELAVFLGRQKYLEGMVPLLTTLFDAPDFWSSRTIGRGDSQLVNVALSFLAASTLEWLVEALPREAFSGGFMSRLLFVVQQDTDRTFALPERGRGYQWEALREALEDLKELSGEVILEPEARVWYLKWYNTHHKTPVFDDKFAGYHERKPDHMLRIALLIRISISRGLTIRTRDLERALKILDWLEELLPSVFDGVSSSPQGADHQRIIGILQKHGGSLPHSVLLRKNQHIMNARRFNEAIYTLTESEMIKETRTNVEHSYELIYRRKE